MCQNMKKIFYTLYLATFFVKNSYADSISDGVNQIAGIINSKSPLSTKEVNIAPIVKSLMDYNSFFKHIAGNDIWNSLKENQSKIIDLSNKKYVENYFNKITECETFSIKEIGDTNGSKRFFEYLCNGDSKKLDIISRNGKVLDVQISGASFIQTEKAKLESCGGDDKKKEALMKGEQCQR